MERNPDNKAVILNALLNIADYSGPEIRKISKDLIALLNEKEDRDAIRNALKLIGKASHSDPLATEALVKYIKDENNEIPLRKDALNALSNAGELAIPHLPAIIDITTPKKTSSDDPSLAVAGPLAYDAHNTLDYLCRSNPKMTTAVLKLAAKDNYAGAGQLKSICKVVCDLAKKTEQWTKDYYLNPDHSNGDRDEWSPAILSLKILFLLKASKACRDNQDFAKSLAKRLLFPDAPSSEADSYSSCPRPNKFPQFDHWVKSVGNIMQKNFEGGRSAFDIYAKQFFLLLYKELENTFHNKTLLPYRWADAAELDLLLLLRQRLPANPSTGSFMITYSTATTLINLPDSANQNPDFKNAINDLRTMVNTSKKDFGSAFILPYNFPSFLKDKEIPPTERGSAARAVPVHLALYLKDNDQKNISENLDNLITSLENWVKYMPDLKARVAFGATHVGDDMLAPYYFYSSAPYVTAAIRLLLEKGNLDQEKQSKLLALEQELKTGLLEMVGRDGLFIRQGATQEQGYLSSPSYANPLGGLALLSLAGSCENPGISSSGILPTRNDATKKRIRK